MIKKYILQEKHNQFEGLFWLDVTKSEDIDFIYKLYKSYCLKHGNNYRVVVFYE